MANSGATKHADRLKRMSKNAAQKMVQALYLAGQAIELEAERSITAGSISGKGHVPSAPGTPPNQDTGVLSGNIETHIVAQNPPRVHVTSHAPYSAFLEFGTSKMAERPFMRPAAQKKRGEALAIVRRGISQLTTK